MRGFFAGAEDRVDVVILELREVEAALIAGELKRVPPRCQ